MLVRYCMDAQAGTPEDIWLSPRECAYLMLKSRDDDGEYAAEFIAFLRDSLREQECQPASDAAADGLPPQTL